MRSYYTELDLIVFIVPYRHAKAIRAQMRMLMILSRHVAMQY